MAAETKGNAGMTSSNTLRAIDVELSYGGTDPVVSDLTLEVPDGQVTVICGPNGCGKSTLLRALARLLKPRRGAVELDGVAIARLSTRHVATRIGLLPQSPTAPEGLTVADLVARGRFPHQRWFQQWMAEDEHAVESALTVTRLRDLRDNPVDQLSGGQRQRAWIAMALAQDTGVLLLDEPTTFLDLAHRLDVLELMTELNSVQERTVVMVLHDLNEACRYAHHIVAMRDGELYAQGPPREVVTTELVRDVFAVDARVIVDPVSGTPLVVPVSRIRS